MQNSGFATLVLLIVFQNTACARRVDYRINILNDGLIEPYSDSPTAPPTAPTSEDCKNSTGMICSGCSKVYTCIKSGGEYKPIFSRVCARPEYCLSGACSTEPNPDCSPIFKYKFQCNSLGIFPDPLDCKKYYYCYPKDNKDTTGQLAVATCSSGFGYNPKTTYCSNKLVNEKCSSGFPVPVCNKTGDTGALKENTSIYFICLPYSENETDLYPFLFACDNGGVYDTKTYGCKLP